MWRRASIADLQGADAVIDIHASNIYLRELPQVRVNINMAERLVPMARRLNMDFIWVHAAATVLESTLAYSLNALDTPHPCRRNGGSATGSHAPTATSCCGGSFP